MSDDGRHGITIIAFVGSVFSPWYAAARRGGPADPENFVSLNVALYGPGGRWAMTERRRGALVRTKDRIEIGPSAMTASPGRIEIDIDEWSVPLPRRLKGRVVIETGTIFDAVHPLDAGQRHLWRPIAPGARAEVTFTTPGLGWQGSAYVDSNFGDEPLEEGFRSWTWSRAHRGNDTAVFYDVEHRDAGRHRIAIAMHPDGRIVPIDAPRVWPLPPTLWRVPRTVRSETAPDEIRTFEDTPFYTRTGARSTLDGKPCATICESVDLDRFASRWVQTLLPFRMPRR